MSEMKSERSAATETENEGSRTTVMEEFTSSSKRRKIWNDSSFSSDENSENNSTTPSHYLKSTDLRRKNSETEVSTFSNGEFIRETSQSSELCLRDSEEAMESSSTTTERKASSQKIHAAQTPPAAEIEEFFSTAEKREQKRFSEKYNYDIVKDVPLEGKYKWIPLKP